MIKDIRLPEVSENIQKADVVKVLVAVGDVVRTDQPLLEVETEKAMFELPSPEGGTVREVLVKAGDAIAVGQVLIRVETAAAADQTRPAPPPFPGSAARAGKPLLRERRPAARNSRADIVAPNFLLLITVCPPFSSLV